MSIFLIRHAESEANINGKTSSHSAIALSENGHIQAQELCKKLPKIDHVIVSAYLRTQQTAQPVLEKYNLQYEIHPYLHEFSYLSEGKCANTNMDDRKAWVNAYWERMDPYYKEAEDAESFEDLFFRVAAVLGRVKADQEKYKNMNLAVFSHGQFLQLLIMQMTEPKPLSQALMREFRLSLLHSPLKNTEIFELNLA